MHDNPMGNGMDRAWRGEPEDAVRLSDWLKRVAKMRDSGQLKPALEEYAHVISFAEEVGHTQVTPQAINPYMLRKTPDLMDPYLTPTA